MTELIYQQLLELYILDLEIELLAEKLKNVNTGTPQIPVPYPWQRPPQGPWFEPYYYGPPYRVTCQTDNTSGTTNSGEII
jgi:hypothetical protein